ncbi:hypothetical protein [Rhizobium etli]|uniref:Uncharacterized protein n=1 Tax=Rhizobium etli TaxID=29449 RepID=A0A7W6VDF3_RHIET|nr:hypothetical protein [Rhizobium etli]MBB4481145.1 hypothetical protein [Rhizobium etli]MBB4537240.1 hypothetical protein [Rhizobium etli]
MPVVEHTIEANLNQEKRDIRDWVEDSFNKEILYDEPLSETIEPFVRDGKSPMIRPSFRFMAFGHKPKW